MANIKITVVLILLLVQAINNIYCNDSNSLFNSNILTKIINEYLNSNNCNSKCCQEMQFYMKSLFNKTEWALKMFDSTSKLQSGILLGNFYELGSFDECIAVSTNTQMGNIKGKYCSAKIKIPDWLINKQKVTYNDSKFSRDLVLPAEDSQLNFRFAFCIPATCTAQELETLINRALKFIDLDSAISENDCFVYNSYKIETIDIVAIVIISVIVLLVIISTLYDLHLAHINKKTNYPILICFSLYTNGYHLFKTTPIKENTDTLNSLIGIRFLSITWIVYGHCYFLSGQFPVYNFLDSYNIIKSFGGQMLVGSTITVDTFLVMSGLLVSYTLLRQFKNGLNFKDSFYIYLHRYIRITPPYAMVILFQSSIIKFFGSGPLWDTTVKSMSFGCDQYWWSALLYIQNYVNPKKICVAQSWYLSVDMQLFWIAPLLIMFIKKFNRFTYIIIGSLTVVLMLATFIIASENSILAGLISGTGEMSLKRQTMMYIPTHTRAAPWLIGFALGYYLHKNRGVKVKIHPILVTIGWITSFLIMFAVIFGMYPFMQTGHKFNIAEDASYLTFNRFAWGIAISWLIFACENGYGGPINWLLTLRVFQPLARLSYCVYLVHFAFQKSIRGVMRLPLYYTHFQMFYNMLSDWLIALIIAVILSLTFESPMIIIEKTIFRNVRKSTTKFQKEIEQLKKDESYKKP